MRCQFGIEYLIMLGFLFLILTPLVIYSVDTMRFESRTHQARRVVDVIAETIDSVGAQGFPARATVDLVFPEDTVAGSYVANKTVVIKLAVPEGTRDIVATHDRCAEGVLPAHSGLYRVTIRARQDGCVELSMELILIDPTRFDITISAGADTNQTITFFNLMEDTTMNLTVSGDVQAYIDLNRSTPGNDPFVEFDLAKGTNERIFSAGPAPIGSYTGTVTAEAPGFTADIPITLTVIPTEAENWFRRGIDLKEFVGKNRVNEPVDVWVNFGERGNPALYVDDEYNSIRVQDGITDTNYTVQIWNISRASPVFINSATLTFLANVSANDQDSTYEYYVYYHDEDKGNINYTTDLLYEYDTIQNSYYFISQKSSGILSEVRNKLGDGQNNVGNENWGFFQYRTSDTENNEPTSGTKTVTCGNVFCEVNAHSGPWSEVQSSSHNLRFYAYSPEIHSWNTWTMNSQEGMQTLNFFVAENHDWNAFTQLNNNTIVNATLDESGGGVEGGWTDAITNSKGSRWDSWIGLDSISLNDGSPITGYTVVIPSSSAGWRYYEMITCGNNCDPRDATCTPPSGWKNIGFDDSGWTYISTPDSGWGGTDRNRFYRRKFTVSSGELSGINTMRVWTRSRQGIECWINGINIGHDGACRYFSTRDNTWVETDTSMLVVGDNVLSCQVAEIYLPDGYFDASLEFNPSEFTDNFAVVMRYLKNKTSDENLTIHGNYDDGGSAQQIVGWENKYSGGEIELIDLIPWSDTGWKVNQSDDCGNSCDPRSMTCSALEGWNLTSFNDTEWNSTSTPDTDWGCDNCTRFYRKQFNITDDKLVNAKNFTLYVRNQEGVECFLNNVSIGYDSSCHSGSYYSNEWGNSNLGLLYNGTNVLACQVKEDVDLPGGSSLETADSGQITGDTSDRVIGGDYTDTQSNDNNYYYFGWNSVGWWSGRDGWMELSYDISSLGISASQINTIQVQLRYCYSGGANNCGGGDAPNEVTYNTQDVEIWDFTNSEWDDIGDITVGSSNTERDGEWNVTSGFSDYVSGDEIRVRFEHNIWKGWFTGDSRFVVDYTPITVYYSSTGGDEYFDAKLELLRETYPGFDYSPGDEYEIAIDMLITQNQTCCGYAQDFYARRTHPLAVSLGEEETI